MQQQHLRKIVVDAVLGLSGRRGKQMDSVVRRDLLKRDTVWIKSGSLRATFSKSCYVLGRGLKGPASRIPSQSE